MSAELGITELKEEQTMKEIFQVIHSEEVESFLTKLGLNEQIKNENIKCYICGDIITKDNFKIVTRKGDQLLVACNKEHCLLPIANFKENM